MTMAPALVGVLNVTEDSFSDGGRFLSPAAAIAHGERLLDAGAHWLDLGAESSNPAAASVPAEVEIARLEPVVRHFIARGAALSVDTHKAATMRAMIALGVTMVNDITALADPEAAAVLAAAPAVRVVLMYSRERSLKARDHDYGEDDVVAQQLAFFRERIAYAEQRGIAAGRLILDPGMGHFLGNTPAPSVATLRALATLKDLGLPVYLGVSRKSFVGALAGQSEPGARGAASLAAELWAAEHGADFIRTHDVRALADGLRVWRALAGGGA